MYWEAFFSLCRDLAFRQILCSDQINSTKQKDFLQGCLLVWHQSFLGPQEDSFCPEFSKCLGSRISNPQPCASNLALSGASPYILKIYLFTCIGILHEGKAENNHMENLKSLMSGCLKSPGPSLGTGILGEVLWVEVALWKTSWVIPPVSTAPSLGLSPWEDQQG